MRRLIGSSTLFPYTTLFRSNGTVTSSNAVLAGAILAGTNGVIAGVLNWTSGDFAGSSTLTVATNRLEEHTSELQSHSDLVWRLLNVNKMRLVSGNLSLYCNP